MVERFNGRISEVVKQTRFASAAELETTLMLYLKTYNHSIAQRALKHLTPVAALKRWQQEKPELFVKRVYNQAELDTQPYPQMRLMSTSTQKDEEPINVKNSTHKLRNLLGFQIFRKLGIP